MMMHGGLMSRLLGVFAIIPTAILLTISFFVLVVISRIEKQGLKAFGYVVAALLWLAALLVISTGVYTLSTGHCPIKSGMQCMMKEKMMEGGMGRMSGAMPMMMQGSMGQPTTKK